MRRYVHQFLLKVRVWYLRKGRVMHILGTGSGKEDEVYPEGAWQWWETNV